MIANKLAFFDLDKTIYDGFTVNDFCLFMAKEVDDMKWLYAENTRLVALYVSGQIDYKKASILINSMIADALKGLTVYQVHDLLRRFFSNNENFYKWAIELFEVLKKAQFDIVLVSGSVEPIVAVVSKMFDLNAYYCSKLIIENEMYTGNLAETVNFELKQNFIKTKLQEYDAKSLKLGFGDSTGDVAMLEMMDYGFVVNPHQSEMIEIANKNNWYVSKDGSGVISNVIKAIEKFEFNL